MAAPGLPRWIEAPVAAAALVALTPLLGLIAVAVRLDSSGPALFRHVRIGRDGQPFQLAKFRTMVDRAGGPAVTAGGDPRITRVGRWLRRSKLDELPQLAHVVTGAMALVGPRPEVPDYVDLDDPRWRAALAAPPGLTDPATRTLRDEEAVLAQLPDDPDARADFYRAVLVPYKLMLARDYARRRTPLRDLVVLVDTLRAIVRPSTAPPPTPAALRQRVAADGAASQSSLASRSASQSSDASRSASQ
ncbi:MAG: sugar transferase [Acidobacteriota bacterium]